MPNIQIIKHKNTRITYSWTDGVKKIYTMCTVTTHDILRIATKDPDKAFDIAMDRNDEALAEYIYNKYT